MQNRSSFCTRGIPYRHCHVTYTSVRPVVLVENEVELHTANEKPHDAKRDVMTRWRRGFLDIPGVRRQFVGHIFVSCYLF
jgi:hypothetical protein